MNLTDFSRKCVDHLMDSNIDPDKAEICAYGLELALHTLLSTSVLLLIGFLAHRLGEAALIIFLYYANQTAGGGYHAKSHFMCTLLMAIGLIVCLYSLNLFWPVWLLWILPLCSATVLWCFPVHLHLNKRYLSPEMSSLKKKSRLVITTSVLIAFLIIILHLPGVFQKAAALGITVSAISRVSGILSAPKTDHSPF